MTQTLNKYYLQQMGIVTWERRNIAPSHHDVGADSLPKGRLMIVVDECVEAPQVTEWWRSKSGNLLKKMLFSIGLSESAPTLVFESIFDVAMPIDEVLFKEKFACGQPKLILVLGKRLGLADESGRLASLSGWFLQNYPNTPVFFSVHPEDLLNVPLKKKKAFNDLMWIQRQLLS